MNSFTAMDQVGKYWGIWGASTRRSSSTAAAASPFPAAAWATQAGGRSEPSWEERAFARDAAEHLGGCVWPPRSYSCTFCHREFRSAQALGGHMNVHRRDRALLRQGGSSPEDQPQQSGALLCRAAAAAAASNPNTTTATSAADEGVTTTPPSFLSTIIKESKNKLIMSSSMDQYGDFDVIGNDDGEESARGIKRRCLDHPSAATAALLIFVQPMAAEVKSCESSQGLLQGLPLDHHDANNKVPQSSTSPNTSSSPDQQEVDLELRLGTTPKVT